jgi:hypothetical protein
VDICIKTKAYLLSYQQFLNGSEIFERRQENMAIFGTPNVLNKVTKLFAQSSKDLIFVFHRFCEQLLAAPRKRFLRVVHTI